MTVNSEKPFDDFGCLELLLFYYGISKTIVFWTNVLWISCALINGSFGQSCFAVITHAEMVVQRICSLFRMKPLDMKHFQEDTMIMRQQRQREKVRIAKIEWLKRKMFEEEIQNEISHFMFYDKLAEALDFVLGTESRNGQRYCGDRGEEADSMPFAKPATKDLSSFRNLNTATDVLDALDTSTDIYL
ncbi:uncharacterized protein LOC100573268 [Acyrthosiphon pisum]|uniref:Uncharacterized protein n=1 Tax=Acyrthosiphon pisum TaxID=7029 RepID=A0A8R1W7H9_ACYPI|nr:uncharacterized protein LOC100573268 [Acyrthosiphon pisum]|eukprot:XP_003242869.1 PREDICTED: uncharacterized protein LOC100573268 [Acyrthosiphon pisum]